MKLVLDNINSITGWSASGGSTTIHGLNEVSQFIAGNNTSSIIFKFNGLDSYVEKIYDTDVSDYDELVIWMYSISKGKKTYRTIDDYNYKIDLGSGKEYYLQINNEFYWINIDISDIDTIDRIRITAAHSEIDYIVMSYAVVSKDIFPYDLFQGIKEQIEYEINQNVTLKNIGQISGSTGDQYITITNPEFLDRHMAIKINDGVNNEIHYIEKVNDTQYHFGQLFDGTVLLNDYVSADVYIYYPVLFGTTQKEVVLPSITIWGFAPERELLTHELDNISDTVKTDNTFLNKQVGQYLLWNILIDCEALEEWELLGNISKIVRDFVGKKIIWINGMKANIDFTSSANELYPNESHELVPKIQYPTSISIREDLYARQSLPATTTINLTTTIVDQGEL